VSLADLDHYAILGLHPQVPAADIQASYRRRLRETHPDRGGDLNEFYRVQEAWETLSHPGLRREYDLLQFGRRDAKRFWRAVGKHAHRRIGTRRLGFVAIGKMSGGLREATLARAPELLASIAARLGGRSRSWRQTEWATDLFQSPRPVRHAFGLIQAAIRMRLFSGQRQALRVLCWVLASEVRTWTPLGLVLAWGGWETVGTSGPGSAICLVLGGAASFAGVIPPLRKHLGVTVQQRQEKKQSGPDR